jgi:hypothetical protein
MLARLVLALFLCVAWATEVHAGYAKVASVSAASSNGGVSVTTGAIDTTGANLIVCATGSYEGGGEFTPTDSKGNTYSTLTASLVGNGPQAQIHYVFNPTVGSGHTFSGGIAGTFPAIACIAFSGSVTSPFDQENGNTTASAASLTTGSVTPTENNELLIAVVSWDAAITNLAINESFTLDQSVAYGSGQNEGLGLAFFIQGTAGALNPQWTWTTSRPAAARIATFKAAATAASSTRRSAIILQ